MTAIEPGDKPGELRMFGHGFVRLDAAMADDLSVVNSARVSFAVRKEEMDDRDAGLIKFMMRDRHGSPFEHNSFRFHIRTPIFVAREWFRHRIGCLTGDTVVTFVNNEGSTSQTLSKTIDELWRMWTVGEGGVSSPAKECERSMRLRVLNEESGVFESGQLADVVDKGVQPVYRVKLADGKKLTLTENHRVLTSEGWATLREAVGLVGAGTDAVITKMATFMTNGLVLTARLDRTVATLSPSAALSEGQSDNVPPQQRARLGPHPVAVISVQYVGLRQTYDLCVEGPWHNFVANGIVVHNSFNEESARYHQLEGDFYVPDRAAVRSQVGKPGAYSFEPVQEDLAGETIDTFRRVYKELYAEYLGLVEKGVAKELARSILPFGIFTQFYWTINARSLMNFLSLRNAEPAQYEIRVYAEAVERLFAEKMPITYQSFVDFGRRAP